MILGIMSDTHGRYDLMQRVADLMAMKFNVDAVVHLGDDYADTVQMDAHGRSLYAVPGVFEDAWNDRRVERRMIKKFEGVSFMLSHTPARHSHDGPTDMDPSRALSKYGAEVLLHGHTHHRRAVILDDGLIAICPGHLKAELDRGEPPSFAIVEIKQSTLKIRFTNPQGTELEEVVIPVSSAKKYSSARA
jgi:putative phosphoesterase